MAIQRGEISFINLNPVQGREPAGYRPVFVLSIDVINQLPLVVTGVVGTKGENITRDYPTQVGHSLGSASGKRPAPLRSLGVLVMAVFFAQLKPAWHR